MREQEADFVIKAMNELHCTECNGKIKTGEYVHYKGEKKICFKCEGI